jgi:hypothetical protein
MSRTLRCLPIFAALLWAAVMPVRAEDKPLVSATSDRSSPVGIRPSPGLTSFVIKTMGTDWRERVDECLADQELPKGDYASILRAAQVKPRTGHSLWFVRPATNPYCMALYGAHLFNYFLVEQYVVASKVQYRLVFQNGGDGFAIYQHLSHGLNDIEATGCIMTGCRAARMEFDGQKYRPVLCTLTHFDKDQKEIKVTRPCGSDDGRDDQASGFKPSDR